MMENNHKDQYPRQIVIGQPLWDYMMFCEVYCTAACCEEKAFEINEILLLRKTLDYNLAGLKGRDIFNQAWKQVIDLNQFLNCTNIQTVSGEVPIWKTESDEWPEYSLSAKVIKGWFREWQNAFTMAAKHSM